MEIPAIPRRKDKIKDTKGIRILKKIFFPLVK
jgi:hypothetical protein